MTVTVGVSPQQNPVSNHIFVNPSSPQDEFTFDLSQVKSSVVAGIGAKYAMGSFFLAAETQYSKREYVYDVSYTYAGFPRSPQNESYSDAMHILALPVNVGVDLGVIDVTSGLAPQWIVSHHSELEKIAGYQEDLKRLRLGWQSGIAVHVNNLRLGMSWHMDFNNYAEHASLGSQSLSLEGNTNRLLGTISYQF